MAETNRTLAQLARFFESILISCGSTGAFKDYFASIWYPLNVFARRRGHSPDDVQDLTQGFFKTAGAVNLIREVVLERGEQKLAELRLAARAQEIAGQRITGIRFAHNREPTAFRGAVTNRSLKDDEDVLIFQSYPDRDHPGKAYDRVFRVFLRRHFFNSFWTRVSASNNRLSFANRSRRRNERK